MWERSKAASKQIKKQRKEKKKEKGKKYNGKEPRRLNGHGERSPNLSLNDKSTRVNKAQIFQIRHA